jgi:hypothetical protein
MKVIVTTLAFGDLPYFSLSNRINRNYCDIHGYEFRVIPPSEENGRSQIWLKVSGVATVLRDADFVLFLDADAYFADFSKSLMSLIERMGDAAVLLGSDRRDKTFAWSDRNANTGVFIVRNSEAGFRVLDEWWHAPDRYDRRWLWTWPPEQGAFNYIVRPLFPEYIIKVIPYIHMNGHDGIFIRHLIGMPNQERVRILEGEAKRLIKSPAVE